jgi:hypothetical protein
MGGCHLSPTMQAAWGCYSLAAQRCAGACWITSPGQSTCASWRGAWPPRKPTCSWSWAAGWRRQAAVGSGVGWHRSREAAAHAAMSNMGVQQLPGLSSLAAECPPAIADKFSLPAYMPWLCCRWSATGSGSWRARSRRLRASQPAPARWVKVCLRSCWCNIFAAFPCSTQLCSKTPSLPCLLAVADPSPALLSHRTHLPACLPACLPGPAALLPYFILALLPAAVGG